MTRLRTPSGPNPIVRPYPKPGLWVFESRCFNTPREDLPDFYAKEPTGPRAAAARRKDGTSIVTARLREFCNPCPVRLKCLEYALACEALDPYSAHGFWGGLTFRERNRILKDRKRSAA